MAKKDLFEDLCKYYEFIMGPLPKRDEFKRALQDTVSADELSIFFLLPFSGKILFEKLKKKARMPVEDLKACLDHMALEGIILAFDTPEGLAFERGNPVFMTEQQVRKQEDIPRRTFYATLFNTFIEGGSNVAPNKTPYYRVLPVEAALKSQTKTRTITIDKDVQDPRGALPLDIISEMIKKDGGLIGVAECYCRKSRQIVGEACEHPLETCFVFNELAQTLINNGIARKIDYDETMKILSDCEKQGLVHNVDNCAGGIRSLCNCCACSCVVLKMWERGFTNAGAPSRFVVEYDNEICNLCETCLSCCPSHARAIQDDRMAIDSDLCLGCGLCVAACPRDANSMVLRKNPSKISPTYAKLYGKIGREVIVGKVKTKIFGR